MAKNSRLVYSSDAGRVPKQSQQNTTRKGDGIVRVRREKKGRGGKTVTTVSGLSLDSTKLKELASELKRKCGSGGSVVNGVIEVQGDKVDAVMNELAQKGYQAKHAGG